jgi:hypothetical protein
MKVYLKWFLFSLSGLMLKYLIAFPLTPFLILMANKDGNLPRFVYWFQTHDATVDGDHTWPGNRPFKNESNKFKRYINRCFWLWRNSIYGFSDNVFGYKHHPDDVLIVKGDERTTNTFDGHSGYVSRKIYRKGKLKAFQFFRVKQWGKSKKCTRLNIGWKLWGGQGEKSQLCFSYTPYKTFGDKQ